MKTQWIVFASILTINAIIALALSLVVGRKRYAPGSQSVAAMFISLVFWTFGYAMITLSPTMAGKLFWLKVENIGIVTLPVLWLFFAIQYTRNDKWISRPWVILYWIVPVVTLVLLFSGIWFDVYYTSAVPVDGTQGPLVVGKGFWYIPQMAQSYGFLAIGFGLLLWHMFRLRDIYRRQIVFVLGALLAPLLVNIFYQIGSRLVPSLYIKIDLTPISFTITAILIGIGVFNLRMFDLIPIARHAVLENIPEMVLVVDSFNRILDANRTALNWLNKSANEVIGKGFLEVFSLWSGLAGRFANVHDIREEVQLPGTPPRTLELMISPLYNDLGVLEGRVIVARDISERKDLETAHRNANIALRAQVAEIESLRQKLQEQAIRDPLTGVYNRRFLAESLENEVARSIRDRKPISVIILDVDHFKRFNDTYGHKCGDMILQSLGEFLTGNTRRGDIVCRYGGEEFTILLPDADNNEAFARAEDWRARFEAFVIDFQGQKLQTTFSVGVASFPDHGNSGEALLQAADRALYVSKAAGRNRVTVASGG